MLPSRPVDWVTPSPEIRKVTYPARSGWAEGDLYSPPGPGPHPAILVCLGVVPFGVDHPQVPVLGRALARSGIVCLLYWSPSMRDFRLDPDDIGNIALAYNWLIDQPYVDAARSGMLGTCVGGAFAIMASAQPLIRDKVALLSAYAPFSSMSTFALDIASSSCDSGDGRQPWQVDQLTRKVFVHSVTDGLDPSEASRLRDFFEGHGEPVDPGILSADGRAAYSLLAAEDLRQAESAMQLLPSKMQRRLAALSPMTYLEDLRAPVFVLLHDRGDHVIPVGESRRLVASLDGRSGLHYTEMQFQHLDPVKGRLPLWKMVRELGKFLLAMYPVFRHTV
jgi:hypothetical protein